MPETLDRPATNGFERAPTRKRFTREEVKRLYELGMIDGRYELIDGEIISKMGQNPGHIRVTKEMLKWLAHAFGLEYTQSQSPVDVAAFDLALNEPEPDLFATNLPDDAFFDRIPLPNEVDLIVEVSDSSLSYDLTTKANVYARSGFREYWVIDIVGRRIVTHRNPSSEGYLEILAYSENEVVSPLVRPDAELLVSDVLPPLNG